MCQRHPFPQVSHLSPEACTPAFPHVIKIIIGVTAIADSCCSLVPDRECDGPRTDGGTAGLSPSVGEGVSLARTIESATAQPPGGLCYAHRLAARIATQGRADRRNTSGLRVLLDAADGTQRTFWPAARERERGTVDSHRNESAGVIDHGGPTSAPTISVAPRSSSAKSSRDSSWGGAGGRRFGSTPSGRTVSTRNSVG